MMEEEIIKKNRADSTEESKQNIQKGAKGLFGSLKNFLVELFFFL